MVNKSPRELCIEPKVEGEYFSTKKPSFFLLGTYACLQLGGCPPGLDPALELGHIRALVLGCTLATW